MKEKIVNGKVGEVVLSCKGFKEDDIKQINQAEIDKYCISMLKGLLNCLKEDENMSHDLFMSVCRVVEKSTHILIERTSRIKKAGL